MMGRASGDCRSGSVVLSADSMAGMKERRVKCVAKGVGGGLMAGRVVFCRPVIWAWRPLKRASVLEIRLSRFENDS